VDWGGAIAGLRSESVNDAKYSWGIEMPFDEEAVRGHAAMERAGGDAVEVGNVAARDGAESVEIEVGVFGFERVEGPLDEADVAPKGVFALHEFELAADAAIAVRWQDSGHVGVEVRCAVVEADVGFGETDHGVVFKGAEDLAAGVVGDDVGHVGFGVEFGVGPDFAGDLDAAVEVVEGVEEADGDFRHGGFSVIR